MNKTLEGMARHVLEKTGDTFFDEHSVKFRAEELQIALLWLADNVSDEMGCALLQHLPDTAFRADVKKAISAALRAAAGDKK